MHRRAGSDDPEVGYPSVSFLLQGKYADRAALAAMGGTIDLERKGCVVRCGALYPYVLGRGCVITRCTCTTHAECK